MSPELAITWGISLTVETGLLWKLYQGFIKTKLNYPWFLYFICIKVITDLSLGIIRLTAEDLYYPIWLIFESLVIIVQIGMVIETLIRSNREGKFGGAILLIAFLLSGLLSILVYLVLGIPIRWPDAALEYVSLVKGTLYSFFSIFLISLTLLPWRFKLIKKLSSLHSLMLAIYFLINSAAFFSVGKTFFNTFLMIMMIGCYGFWLFLFTRNFDEVVNR